MEFRENSEHSRSEDSALELVDQASKGESFIIAKAGKPIVKVTPLSTPIGPEVRRLGFMEGYVSVPDDFDRMGQEEIETVFGGGA